MAKAILIDLAFIATLQLALVAAAAAQSLISRQDQMDCRPDAMRLCALHIGKPDQMRVCLTANKEKLSDVCRKVVEASGG